MMGDMRITVTWLFCTSLLACGDDEGSTGAGGHGASTSASTTVAGPTSTATSTATSSATTGGGGEDCETGSAELAIGPDGGSLSFCGALLEVPAGAVSESTTFGIAIDLDPPAVPFERELVSAAYLFTPVAPVLAAPVSITLPHPDLDARFELAREDGGVYQAIEACEIGPMTIQQFVFSLGGYAALRDVNDYPDGPTGLGDGTVDLSFLMTDSSFNADDVGNYAIFAGQPDGGQVVTVRTLRDVPGGLESLRLDIQVDAAGDSGTIIQVEWISTALSQGYSYIDGLVGSDGALTITTTPKGRLIGDLSAIVHGGDPPHDEPLVASFDVAVEKFTFPSELVCPGGKKPGP